MANMPAKVRKEWAKKEIARAVDAFIDTWIENNPDSEYDERVALVEQRNRVLLFLSVRQKVRGEK